MAIESAEDIESLPLEPMLLEPILLEPMLPEPISLEAIVAEAAIVSHDAAEAADLTEEITSTYGS